MDNAQLEELVKKLEPEAEIKAGKQYTEVSVPPSKLYSLAKSYPCVCRINPGAPALKKRRMTEKILLPVLIDYWILICRITIFYKLFYY